MKSKNAESRIAALEKEFNKECGVKKQVEILSTRD